MSESNNKRIAKNTVALYIRQIVSILLGLITVKITFKVLGESDYGVYGVVCGVIALMSFLQGVMASGSQRFFSFAIGKQDDLYLKKLFSVTLSVYLAIIGIILLFGETAGLWFVNSQLNIPADRMVAANWIYQFSIITTVFSLVTAPFMSSIFAHEDMGIYAKLTILDAVLKITVVSGLYFLPGDKLIIYGSLLLLCSFIYNSIYIVFCLRHYGECHTLPRWNKPIFKEIISFNGWNLFGAIAWIGKTQGVSFILNIYFGPIINAAQSIATTIKTLAESFGTGFSAAIQPQIVKYYASESLDDFFNLVYRGAKMTFFLISAITIPSMFVVEDALHLWLGEVSSYMILFTKLSLVESSIVQLSSAFANANQATGRIAFYQFCIGLSILLILPLSYIALHKGYDPESVYIITIILQFVTVLIRCIFLNRIRKGQLLCAIKKVLLPCMLTGSIAYCLCYFADDNLFYNIHFIVRGVLYLMITIAVFYILGLTQLEKKKIRSVIIERVLQTKFRIR